MPQQKSKLTKKKWRRFLNRPIESLQHDLTKDELRQLKRMTVRNPEFMIQATPEPVRTARHLQWLLHRNDVPEEIRTKIAPALAELRLEAEQTKN